MVPTHTACMIITITEGVLLHTHTTVTCAHLMDLAMHKLCKLSASSVWYEIADGCVCGYNVWAVQLFLGQELASFMCVIMHRIKWLYSIPPRQGQ